jgi:hypothetical protein
MKTAGVVLGAATVAFWSAVGCEAGSVGRLVDTGPLATCGDNCTATEIAASCQATCDKIARTPCSVGPSSDCTTGCSNLVPMAPTCAPLALAFLRCIEPLEPTCSDAGIADFTPCDSAQQALSGCVADAGTSPTVPSGPAGGGVPADVCPNIPRPAAGGAGACSGGGGASSGEDAGAPTCTTSCQDSKGNVWAANCTGTTCICTFNGGQACTCTMAGAGGGCTSCCPGAQG